MSDLKKGREQYDQLVAKMTAKHPERSNLEEQGLYTPLDIEGFDYLNDLGFPGEYPFTRGVQPTMYRGRFWTMRQYAGFGNAKESNERYKYLLQQGQVVYDMPATQVATLRRRRQQAKNDTQDARLAALAWLEPVSYT
ncbi:MAG: methylmalonyl-CoA mutase family protein, partial [Negativicutes bacterium]|nr:methylmalonyl-CoA mutase family protein [Negativicutes bacterium]